MKDLHSHLIYGIDDGSKTIEESIKLLKKMQDNGVRELVLTPHYVAKSKFTKNNKEKLALFKTLNNAMKEENIKIKTYLGNEIFIDESLMECLKNDEIYPMNNGKYVLVELPVMNYPRYTKNIFSELIYNGYKVILAHPERYEYIVKDINILVDLLEMGVLLQGNYPSLFGIYGKSAQKTLKKLLKRGWISFLSGDIHHNADFTEKQIRRKLKWCIKEDYIDDLLENNFDKVINNEEIN